ncbi:IclR family transcriptional regulator [Leptothrix sp. BB-4]
MKVDKREKAGTDEAEARTYAAPALEKGLDILEALCLSEHPLTQKEIAQRVDRSVGEIYRMIACLVDRNYLRLVDANTYGITTKLFELAHVHSPTQRLLIEAAPLMKRLTNQLDQSCHLTVYGNGKQLVLHKVDTPNGMGFSIRAGAEIDVLISSSGRVLLAFQDAETRKLRIEESLARSPGQANPQIDTILDTIRARGHESVPSGQVRGLYAISFPILDTQGHAIASMTVPYTERLDQTPGPSIQQATEALDLTSRQLSARIGGSGLRAELGAPPLSP